MQAGLSFPGGGCLDGEAGWDLGPTLRELIQEVLPSGKLPTFYFFSKMTPGAEEPFQRCSFPSALLGVLVSPWTAVPRHTRREIECCCLFQVSPALPFEPATVISTLTSYSPQVLRFYCPVTKKHEMIEPFPHPNLIFPHLCPLGFKTTGRDLGDG